MTVEYLYQLIGMKEAELQATRIDRDRHKQRVIDLEKELTEMANATTDAD